MAPMAAQTTYKGDNALTTQTHNITMEQAAAILDIRDELQAAERHTIYCQDDAGCFRVTFWGDVDVNTVTLEAPQVIHRQHLPDGRVKDVEAGVTDSLARGWAGVSRFLDTY